MDFYSLISGFFQRHLETTSLAVDALAEATGAAVEQAAEAILNERKLFSIGLGADCAGATEKATDKATPTPSQHVALSAPMLRLCRSAVELLIHIGSAGFEGHPSAGERHSSSLSSWASSLPVQNLYSIGEECSS